MALPGVVCHGAPVVVMALPGVVCQGAPMVVMALPGVVCHGGPGGCHGTASCCLSNPVGPMTSGRRNDTRTMREFPRPTISGAS